MVCLCIHPGVPLKDMCISHQPNCMSYSLFPLSDINIVFAIKQTPPPPHTRKSNPIPYPSLLCAWEDNSESYSTISSRHTTLKIHMNSFINSFYSYTFRDVQPSNCLIVNTLKVRMQDSWVSRRPGLPFPEINQLVQYQMLFLLIQLCCRSGYMCSRMFGTWVELSWKLKQSKFEFQLLQF